MRPRSAPAAPAATAAAHRSAGKQGCQGPVVRACKGGGDRPFSLCEERIGALMGKGDPRTRRGKLYQGSFGKSRPKDPAKRKKKAAQPPSAERAGRRG